MYRTVYKPEHARADITGRVSLHVLIEEKIRGPIPKGTVIHHKNWNKLHNPEDGSNYQRMTRIEHQQLPALQARFIIEKGLLNEFFEWWQIHKDDVDEIQELETRIARLEEQQDRQRVKHAAG